MTVGEQDANHAVIEMRGHLEPAPDTPAFAGMLPGDGIEMVTTYTFECMDPRVRIHSTMTNTTPNAYFGTGSFGPIDTLLWGGRSIAPFCPSPGQGTECRPFDFANPTASLATMPYIGSTGSLDGDPASFALYSDTRPGVTGVHSDQVSVLGEISAGFADLAPGAVKVSSRVLVIDNDGDGDVDADDQALGGIEVSPLPVPLSLVAIGARPLGFANPVFIDVDGNGDYDAPGGPLVDGDLP